MSTAAVTTEPLDARIVRTNLRVIDAKLRARIDDEADNARAGRLRRARADFHTAAKEVLEALA